MSISLVQDEEVKQIIIEKKDVVNERTENNECLIDMQLSMRVVYHEECVRRSSIIRVGKYLEHWLYDLKRHELKASTFDRKEKVIKNQIIPYIGAHVFATRKGKRVHPRNVDRMFRSVLKNCDIKGVGVHALRHTFASVFLPLQPFSRFRIFFSFHITET